MNYSIMCYRYQILPNIEKTVIGNRKVSWFLGFSVSQCLGSLVAWFLGFGVSKFLSFIDSKNCNVFKRDWFHIAKIVFHIFIDIDLISKIFKILLDGSSGFVGARLFQKCQRLGFPNFEIYKNTLCLKMFQGSIIPKSQK